MDLAIDGGQTGLRIGLAESGRIREIRELPGLSYAEGSPVEAVLERIGTGWGPLGTVCLGLTTILDDPGKLAGRLLSMARRVLITTDVVTSHAGAFAGGEGVVLAAGTGAIALGVGDGIRQVDGWGYLYGDAGSGFWIGRRGLDAAFRGFDGRAEPGPLTERAQAVFGDLAGLPERLYLAPDAVARIARFAVHVLELAGDPGRAVGRAGDPGRVVEGAGDPGRVVEGAGDPGRVVEPVGDRSRPDPTARAIAEEAARELAGTVAAAARCFAKEAAAVPVAWTGRLLRDPGLRTGFEAELARLLPQATLRPPAGDSLAGAALLAASTGPSRYQSMIRTAER
ncbi:BadF/BadG/BcrA/BcrD ATPase family protein [Nonomuraea angiospora]|uniref:N-acetylglucosamine kinase-like BadF-type ATPase n=1 Tax=Nonomuraea angiospora TaxID=46172 RepID=A0ABR9M8K1_9ACTN|nr:BadF/BadG/BcrA/BcrD ATPase family protein [Nonomuraea angiospora]MBE1589239.1 N-acetylglucosamine kinase-like BadF-type ATPase [Nonomuraea angiospora]